MQGGERYSPVNEEATLAHPDKETQYNENKAFSKQLSSMFLANYTVSYRMNMKKVSHEFAVKGMNATGYKKMWTCLWVDYAILLFDSLINRIFLSKFV